MLRAIFLAGFVLRAEDIQRQIVYCNEHVYMEATSKCKCMGYSYKAVNFKRYGKPVHERRAQSDEDL